jgi:hypothetical protein
MIPGAAARALGFGETDAYAGALFVFPLVVVAKAGLVFLYLGFKFGEGLLAGGAGIFACAGGVQHAGRQGEIQAEGILFLAWAERKNSMQLHQVRFITFQELGEFFYRTRSLSLCGFVRFDMLVVDGKFHACTCRIVFWKGWATQILALRRMERQHSKRGVRRQSGFAVACSLTYL